MLLKVQITFVFLDAKYFENLEKNIYTVLQATSTTHNQSKRSTNVYVQHAKDPPSGEKVEKADIHLIGWEWEEVGVFITFAIFVFAVGYAKVGKRLHFFLSELNINIKLFFKQPFTTRTFWRPIFQNLCKFNSIQIFILIIVFAV
jgi:hypothetical protein